MSGDLEAAERQTAVTGLLAQPVVERRDRPDLWRLIRRHRPVLTDWFADRLGYRLVVAESAARLYRPPIDGTTIAPVRHAPPSRRVLVLALLAAACAEDAEDLTSVQELSDRVRTLTARDDVPISGYEPDRFAERRLFVRAIGVLVELGVLRPTERSTDDVLTGWAHGRDRVGGAYRVERDLLLRMVEPGSLYAALGRDRPSSGTDHRRFAIMRRLIELPVCLLDDLTPDERAYLVSQRHRLLAWCQEMTGWAPEQRAEGIALMPPGESGTDRPFPLVRADHFGALLILGRLVAEDAPTGVDLLVGAASEVAAQYPKALTKEYLADPAKLAQDATRILAELDLIRPLADGRWRVMPAAARFRSPRVVQAQQLLELDDLDDERADEEGGTR